MYLQVLVMHLGGPIYFPLYQYTILTCPSLHSPPPLPFSVWELRERTRTKNLQANWKTEQGFWRVGRALRVHPSMLRLAIGAWACKAGRREGSGTRGRGFPIRPSLPVERLMLLRWISAETMQPVLSSSLSPYNIIVADQTSLPIHISNAPPSVNTSYHPTPTRLY